MAEQPFILGINYWPQKTAMFMWRKFDRSSIQEDVATIRDLGFSRLSISLLWEDFQPKPKVVPPGMLDQLVEVLEMAADKNLKVMVTLFTGHMNGLNWLPPLRPAPFSSFSRVLHRHAMLLVIGQCTGRLPRTGCRRQR